MWIMSQHAICGFGRGLGREAGKGLVDTSAGLRKGWGGGEWDCETGKAKVAGFCAVGVGGE